MHSGRWLPLGLTGSAVRLMTHGGRTAKPSRLGSGCGDWLCKASGHDPSSCSETKSPRLGGFCVSGILQTSCSRPSRLELVLKDEYDEANKANQAGQQFRHQSLVEPLTIHTHNRVTSFPQVVNYLGHESSRFARFVQVDQRHLCGMHTWMIAHPAMGSFKLSADGIRSCAARRAALGYRRLEIEDQSYIRLE